jgi:hypothetical protein
MASLLVTATYAVAVSWLVIQRPNPLGCASGFDGLGCAIVQGLLLNLAAVLVPAGVGLIALLALRVPHAVVVAIVAAVVVVCVYAGALGGTSAVRFLSQHYGVPPLLSLGLFYTVGLLAGHLIVNGPHLPLPARIAAGLAVCVLSAATTPVAGALDSILYQRQQQSIQEALAAKGRFHVYAPAHLPNGYRLYSHTFNGQAEPSYYELSYIHRQNDIGDPPPLTVHSFSRPSYFDPPVDCGQSQPAFHFPQSCGPIARLANGLDLYRASKGRTYFEVLGTTVVTLDVAGGQTFSEPEVVAIFDSLRELTPRQLNDLQSPGLAAADQDAA